MYTLPTVTFEETQKGGRAVCFVLVTVIVQTPICFAFRLFGIVQTRIDICNMCDLHGTYV